MTRIFHLAAPEHWAEAVARGRYEQSTRGLTLEQQGFIHCSAAEQWAGVRERFYADVAGELVLLEIETGLLDVPLVREVGDPTSGEVFPHLYGPLPVTAVVATHTLAPPHGIPAS